MPDVNKIEEWYKDYNYNRAHSSLGYQTPIEFANSCNLQETRKMSFFHL